MKALALVIFLIPAQADADAVATTAATAAYTCAEGAKDCVPAAADRTPSLSSVGLPDSARGQLDLKPDSSAYGLGNVEILTTTETKPEDLQELRMMIMEVDDEQARKLRGTDVVGER